MPSAIYPCYSQGYLATKWSHAAPYPMLEPDLTIALNTLKSDTVAPTYCEDWPWILAGHGCDGANNPEIWHELCQIQSYLIGLMRSEQPQVYNLLAFQNSMSSRCVFWVYKGAKWGVMWVYTYQWLYQSNLRPAGHVDSMTPQWNNWM